MDYKEWLRTLSNRDLHYLIDRQEKIMQQMPKDCCIERRTKKITSNICLILVYHT